MSSNRPGFPKRRMPNSFVQREKARAGWALVLLLALSACTAQGPASATDPRHRLQDYISKSFAVSGAGDRAAMLGFLTGEPRARLEAWSDDQFREAFIDSKRQFIKLAFQEVKPISPAETDITYELVYIDQAKGRDAKVTNRKLAQMKLERGQWMIADVRSIKELIEYQNELALP